MALIRRYGLPLQVTTDEETRERIRIIADDENTSQAQVIRELIELGLPRREAKSRKLLGKDA